MSGFRELVLDPFAGSGTTAFAALSLGRRFIGWERSLDYYRVALDRIDELRAQPGLAL